MKKNIKEIFQKGLFVTIGGYDISFPIGEKWGDPEELLFDVMDIVNLLIILSAVAAVAMIIVGGYNYILSAGDPDKAEQGQKTLTAAIVGLVIIGIVKLIITFVIDFVA